MLGTVGVFFIIRQNRTEQIEVVSEGGIDMIQLLALKRASQGSTRILDMGVKQNVEKLMSNNS